MRVRAESEQNEASGRVDVETVWFRRPFRQGCSTRVDYFLPGILGGCKEAGWWEGRGDGGQGTRRLGHCLT